MKDLLVSLKHFESHQRAQGDKYGAEVLHNAHKTIAAIVSQNNQLAVLTEEIIRSVERGQQAHVGSIEIYTTQISLKRVKAWRDSLKVYREVI